jgi:hypothetical protein
MRKMIESAVRIFHSHPELEGYEILDLFMDEGIEEQTAIQLLVLLPLAYGRVHMPENEVLFPGTYLCLGEPSQGRLDALPLWAEVLEFAKEDKGPFLFIAGRSAEFRIAERAIQEGKKLESVVWAPPIFWWHIEPPPGSASKNPNWLRRIWDEPAIHSVSRQERTLARAAMVAAVLVGFFAVSLVVYYGLSTFRAIR